MQAAPSPPNASCVSHADTAWVLVCTMLVLLMIPALGLFEAGLLRAKNTTSVLTQVFSGAVLLSFMWHIVGFSLVFGDSLAGIIGSPATYPLMINVDVDTCFKVWAPTVPKRAFAEFQMMFAAIAPLLMTGSFAERIRWSAFVGLIIGFEVFVYYPVAHWIWGGGWLHQLGTLDFAGGIVIHTTAGVGGIVVAWFVGPRRLDARGSAYPLQSARSPPHEESAHSSLRHPGIHVAPLATIPGSVAGVRNMFGDDASCEYAPGAGPTSCPEDSTAKPISSSSSADCVAPPLTAALLPRTTREPHSMRVPRPSRSVLLGVGSRATLLPEESVLSFAMPGLVARLETVPPSSLPLTVTGGALLWLGWFGVPHWLSKPRLANRPNLPHPPWRAPGTGFNAGSAMSAGPLAAVAVSNTQAGAVAGGVVWMGWSCVLHLRQVGRIRLSLAATINGIIAGLAGITPAAGYISGDYALLSGGIFGAVGLAVEGLVKHRLHIDDALDVGAVHGATGAAGALAIGLFASRAVNAAGADGLLAGGGVALLGSQAAGVAVAAAWSATAMALICLGLQRTVGLRVEPEEEQDGLDIADHDEPAYEWLLGSERS